MSRSLALLLALFMLPGCLVGPPSDDDDDDDDDATGDTEGPTVLSSVPSVGQSGVSPAVRIEVQMSEDVADSSSTAITLEGVNGDVPANTWVNGALLLLEPASPLAPGAQYTVFVDAPRVEDLTGNLMEESYGFQFTVEAGDAPTLLSSDPYDGEVAVGINRGITLTFSAPISPGSVTNNSFRVLPDRRVDGQDMGTTGMPGALLVSGNEVSFTPDRGRLQEFDTGYTVDVAGITDLGGNAVWTSISFRTRLVEQAYLYRIRNGGYGTMLDTYDGSYSTLLQSEDTAGTYWWFTPAFGALQMRNTHGGDSLFLEGGTVGTSSLLNAGGQFTGQHWTLRERLWEGGVGMNESPVNYNLTNGAAGPETGLAVIVESTSGNHDIGLETLVSGTIDQEWYLVHHGPR